MSDLVESKIYIPGWKRYRLTMDWLKSLGEDTGEIYDERALYAAIGRALGRSIPHGYVPEDRKIAGRVIRHHVRSGEFVDLPLVLAGPPKKPQKKAKVMDDLRKCFEVGDIPAARSGLLESSMTHRRPTRISVLFEGQGGKCHYCGDQMLLAAVHRKSPKFATVDHVHPKSQGGHKVTKNTVAACADCNSRKGSIPHDEFLSQIRKRTNEVARYSFQHRYVTSCEPPLKLGKHTAISDWYEVDRPPRVGENCFAYINHAKQMGRLVRTCAETLTVSI